MVEEWEVLERLGKTIELFERERGSNKYHMASNVDVPSKGVQTLVANMG